MNLLHSRSLVATVARRFRSQYPDEKYCNTKHGETADKLEALDLATATPAEIAEIIGNKSWTYFTCEECRQPVEQAVELGDGDYGTGRMTFCASCLRASAALASVALS